MQENMKKSLKVAAVTASVLITLSVVVFAFAGSHNNTTADNGKQEDLQNMLSSMNGTFVSNDTSIPPSLLKRLNQMSCNGPKWLGRFLENATLSTVNGTVSSQLKGILILNTDSGQLRILLPKGWSVNNEVVGRAALFNSSYASSGDSVTLKVLKGNVFSNANFSLNIMIGYEAINATGTHAYAVLPFNIEPSS
jgi:hypothetical protein